MPEIDFEPDVVATADTIDFEPDAPVPSASKVDFEADAMPTEQSGSDWLGVGDEVRGVSDSLARGVLRAGQQFNLTALRRQRDIPGEIAKIDQELQQAEGYLSGKTPHPSIAAKGYVTAGDEADYRRAMKKTLGDAERRKMRLQQELDRIAASLPNIKDEFQTSQEMIEQLPLTAAQQDFHKKETPWWKFFANPVELALTTTAESAPQMLPSMVAAPLGIGAVALAAGGSSFGAESSARVLSAMQESGVDLKNPDAVVAWLSDRAKSDPALAKADLAALGPATFDALSGGIAGRWLRGAGGAGAKKIAGAMAKESGAQMLAGGAGSVAGSALAGEDVDWKDVVLEMAAEIAPVEAVSNVAAENGYSIGHYLENRSFDKMSKEAANEEALRQSFARHGTGENLAVNRRQDQSFAQPTAAEAAVQFEPDDELSSQIRQLESDPDVMGHEIVGLDSDGNPKKEPRLKDMKKVRRLEALKALQQQGSLESKIQSELEALPGAEQDLKQPAKPAATNPQLEKLEIVSDMLASLKAEIERNQIEPKSPESSPKSSTSDEITGFDTTASQTTPAPVATPAGAGPVVVDSRPASAAIRDKDTGEIWHGQPLHGMLHDQIPNRAARNLEAGFATKAGKFITAEATEKATGMASGEELFEMSAKELKAWFDVQRQQIGMDEDATPTQKAERLKDLDAKFARATSFKKTGKISAETQGDGRTAGKNSTQGGEHSLPASPGQISRTEPTAGGVGAQVEPSGTPTAATPPESALPAKPVGETSNVGQPTSSQNPSSQEVSTSGAVGSKFKPNAPRKSRSPFWVRPRADGVPDILDAIQELGGIAPLDSKAFGNWRDKFHGPARMLLRKDGRDADLLVDDLNGKHADANTPQTFRVNTVDELLEAISDASAKRDKLRATGGGVEAQADRFWSAIGSEPTNTGGLVKINADQLQTGDKFRLRGKGHSHEELEVRSVADGVVTLKDGKAFGWQEVPEGTEFWVQKKGLEMAQPPAQSQVTDAGRTVSTSKAPTVRQDASDPGALRARERLERDARAFTGDSGIQISLLGGTESVPGVGRDSERGFVGVQRLGELLGASVVKFRAATTGADGKTSTITRINGWTSPDGKYIFINENAQNPALVVFGHELVHSLQRQNPELYKQLEREVLAIQKDRSRYEADARTRKYTGDVSEELVADYVATHFNDPTFLRDLAKRNPTLFKRVVNTLKRYLDAIIGKLKGARFEQGMITQAEQARETLLRVLDEHARGIESGAKAQAETEAQAKADNEPFMAGDKEDSVVVRSASSGRELRLVGADAMSYHEALLALGKQKANELAFQGKLPSQIETRRASAIEKESSKPWGIKLAEKYLNSTYDYIPSVERSEESKYGDPSNHVSITPEELFDRAKINPEMGADQIDDALMVSAAELAMEQWKEHKKDVDDEIEAQSDRYETGFKTIKESVEKTLGVGFRGRPSAYATYRGLKLRISDHEQVTGGGYNMQTDERMGEANIQWLLDPTDESAHLIASPTEVEIRNAVAKALRNERLGESEPITIYPKYKNALESEANIGSSTPSGDIRMVKRNATSPQVEKPVNEKLEASNATVTKAGMVDMPGAFMIEAHHGTPHDVDKFSTAKIGTGEGAQVYGYGLYFAQSPEVADQYRKNLAYKGRYKYDGKEITQTEPRGIAIALLREAKGNVAEAIEEARRLYVPESVTGLKRADIEREIESVDLQKVGDRSNTYTVSLDVEPEDLLDWDKPLSEQHPKVLAKLREAGILEERATIQAVSPDNKASADQLVALGIPGIKYLDQGSRARRLRDSAELRQALEEVGYLGFDTPAQAMQAIRTHPDWLDRWDAKGTKLEAVVRRHQEQDTYNYVIFDENKIKITHKNGQRVSVDEAFMAEADEGRGDNASINRELNALLDKPNPTLRDHARVRELQAQLGQEDLFASAAKPVEQMEAEQAKRSQKDAIATRQSKRLVAGPLESQQDAFEKPDQGEMFMAEADENNLVAIHNTTAEKLRHILKMGGLAVPSVAITRTDKGAYESFGDISLVGNPEMITPRGDTKVLNADAYSPRYPTIKYFLDAGSEKKIVDFVEARIKMLPDKMRRAFSRYSINDNTEQEGIRKAMESDASAALSFIADTGRLKDFKWSEGTKGDQQSYAEAAMTSDVRDFVRKKYGGDVDNSIHEEFLRWIDSTISKLGLSETEKIFNGYTYSGNRRYLTHDLDTVVRIMKKGFRDAEGFDYGVGSVRATVARQFKTLKQIQASRGDITTKASMDAIKAEVDKEFDDLADEALKYRDGGSRSSFAFSDDLKAMAEGGAENMRHLRQMYPNGEPFAKMRAFLDKLRTMPTHYFEAKIKRAVQLQEFSGAVVPDNTPADVIKALEKRGLEVKTYPKGDAEARRKAVQTVGEERNALFMAEAEERDLFKERAPFADSATKRAVRSMLTGDPIGKDFKDAQSRYLGFQKYFEESLRLLITQARRRVHQEFKTTTERKAAMERLGDFWLGKIPVSDVGKNPETQLAAAKFREQLDGLSLTAAQNGMVPDRQVATWIGNTGEWLKRTYLAFDPTADWNYDMLNKRRKREPEIATIWNDAEGYLRRQNPQATDKEIEAQMRHLVDRREVEAAFVGVRQPTDRSAGFSVDTGSLIKRKDIPPALQAWMGVTKDPIARAQQSSKWISQFLARNLMQRELARIGLENGWFSHKAEGRNHVEIYPNTERLVPVIDPVTGKAVETPSGNVEAEYRNNVDRRHEPLHGLYTSPEMLAAMQQFDGLMNTGVAASARLTAVVPQTVLKGVGLWKMGKVALNPASYGVNSFGAVVMRLMAGAVNPIHVVRAVGAIASPRFTVDANSSQRMIQMRARYLMATKAGVIGKGIFTREIDASFGRESEPMAARRAVRALVDILRRRGAGGARKRFANAFMDILKIPGEIGIKWADDVARTSAFLDEFELSKKATPTFSQDQHADWAAERAGNIYQTYDNLPVAIRDLSNIGVLNPFISFTAEIFRNAAWIAHYGYKGIKSGNPALMKDGVQKLAGLTAMTLLPIGLAALSRGNADDDDEKAKRKIAALQRWFVPPWDRGELMVVKSWSKDTVEYIPMTYLLPTAQFSRIPFMVSQIPNNENPDRAINQLVQGAVADVFGGGPLATAGEVLFNSRGGGKQITKAEGWRGIEARAAYAWKSARPGVAAMADEWMKANSGELGYGGRKYTEEEIQAKMLGLRVRTVDTKQAIVSTLREFSSRWAGASSEASIQKSRTPNNTSKIDDAASYKAEKHAEIVKDYEQFLKDCNLIGFTESEVIRLGRDKDVSVPSELKKSAK